MLVITADKLVNKAVVASKVHESNFCYFERLTTFKEEKLAKKNTIVLSKRNGVVYFMKQCDMEIVSH